MAATHEGLLRVSVSPGHLQMACTGDFIALPATKTSVDVWYIKDLARKPLSFQGHRSTVTAVCFSNKAHPLLLCSASEDFIYIWNVTRALAAYQMSDAAGVAVGKDLGSVEHLSFNSVDCLISVCVGKEVWVLNIQNCKLDTVLEGHTALVTQAQFSPHEEFIIVTTSEDRTFKVWDIEKTTLLYQSAIVSAYPFLCVTMDPSRHHIAIGSSDGKIRFYDLTPGNGFRSLHELDVARLLQKNLAVFSGKCEEHSSQGPKVISSTQPLYQVDEVSKSSINDEADEEQDIEAGATVSGLFYVNCARPTGAQQVDKNPLPFLHSSSDKSMQEVFHIQSLLVIGTTAAVIILNCNTWEPLYVLDFRKPLLSSNELDVVLHTLSVAGSYAFCDDGQGNVVCAVGSLFHNTVNIVNIRLPQQKPSSQQAEVESLTHRFSRSVGLSREGVCSSEGTATARGGGYVSHPSQEEITVLSNVPLLSNSPLRSELTPKASTKSDKKGTVLRGMCGTSRPKTKQSAVQDQPLTFKSKVKSSGYREAPRSTMFSPKTSTKKKVNDQPLRKNSRSDAANRSGLIKEYPMESQPPVCPQERVSVSDQPTPINNIVFSGDGRHLACALANKSAHVLRLPVGSKETTCIGHNGPVNTVDFSHDSKWLLTSSMDRTVRLWGPGSNSDGPILVLNKTNHNFVSELNSVTNDKDNPSFSKEINQAKFYYVDKFILLSCGNGLYLYKYHLDLQKEDVKRYISSSRYKLVKLLQQEKAQQVTCFSCVNGFHSYIVLCCGSNRSIEVFDMNVGRSVRVLMDAHNRTVHTICQNEGSSFVSHPPNAYDLFLTAAVSDGIKLWDLRTNSCVRRYQGHCNRTHSVGLAFSPCARYIASGSEDRSAYLYDIRTSTFCDRLTGHTDVVSDVAFHPSHPQLVTAALDGKLRFYSEEMSNKNRKLQHQTSQKDWNLKITKFAKRSVWSNIQ